MSSTERTLVRTISIIFVLLMVLGPVAMLVVPSAVHVPGDAAATAEALSTSRVLLRIGVLAEVVIATSEVVMAIALYHLFRAANPLVAAISAGARLVMAALQGVGAGVGLTLLNASDARLADHGMMLLEFREANVLGWQFFFALHCLTLAVLVWRSGRVPAVLGPLMGMAGLAYLAQSLVAVVQPSAVDTVAAVAPIAILLGELPLFVWMMFRGVRAERTAVVGIGPMRLAHSSADLS